jgi:type VI secretion system protein ImpK
VRIVDCFTDVILYARKLTRGEIVVESAAEARDALKDLFARSETLAEENDFSSAIYADAKFPVVAFVDELFLTSTWAYKKDWQHEPLQRFYFNTTNAGSEFYDRLNVLNKFGPDKDVREVYALCLGLGYKGKYFRGEDRKYYEEVKAFNLSLLLPDESKQDIDAATLFPFAYRGYSADSQGGFKPRLNIFPILIGVPLAIVVALLLFYHFDIAGTLNQIQQLVKY